MSAKTFRNTRLGRTIILIILAIIFFIGFLLLFPYVVYRTLNISTDSLAITAFCFLFLCVVNLLYKPHLKSGKISRLLCIIPFLGFLLSLIAEYIFPPVAPSAADFISLAFGLLNLFIMPAILISLSISLLKFENMIYVISGFIYVLVSSAYSIAILA